jgi:hypothetical protein
MGCMQSPVHNIERRNFKKLPEGKPLRGRFVQFGKTILVEGEKGTLYTNASPLNRSAHCAGYWDWSEELHECMEALGLLTTGEILSHHRWLNRLKEQRDAIEQLGEAKRAKSNGAVSVKVDRKKVLALWDSLDYAHQKKAQGYGYMPDGTQLKPVPEYLKSIVSSTKH